MNLIYNNILKWVLRHPSLPTNNNNSNKIRDYNMNLFAFLNQTNRFKDLFRHNKSKLKLS